MQQSGWSFWVDRGGTFTDFVALSPQGQVHVHKMLSAQHGDSDVVAAGMRAISGDVRCRELRVGTTLATNALLERKGAPCALLVTQGWRDVLAIRYQNRPDIYSLSPHKTAPLYQVVSEASERIDAQGKVLTPLDVEAVQDELERWQAQGIEALAVSFLHAYRNPQHELAVATIARKLGFTTIALSHQVSPRIRYIARTETTTIDAHLTPRLQHYTQQLQQTIRADELLFMQSWGGLRPAQDFRGHSALLSGPAGGVVGAAKICAANNIARAITFDMGGTSTDIALYDGDYRLRHEGVFQGFLLQTPRLAVHTIAAGGGSLLSFDRTRQLVGPESAGAVPGPICYGNGGKKLTVTDANLMLGRIQAQFFPPVCGTTHNQHLDMPAVQRAFAQLANTQRCDPLQLAQGFIDIAVEKMTLAVRQVCIENGSDSRQFTLFCYGGAGAQLICAVAARLGISKIIVHPLASVLSALGIGLAEETERVTQRLHRNLSDLVAGDLDDVCKALASKIKLPAVNRQDTFTLEMRCRGNDHLIDVKETQLDKIAALFHRKYHELFGVKVQERASGKESCEAGNGKEQGALLIENITLEAKQPRLYPKQLCVIPDKDAERKKEEVQLYLPAKGMSTVPLYRSAGTQEGDVVVGPALIADAHTTIVVDAGWQGTFSAALGWTLTHTQKKPRCPRSARAASQDSLPKAHQKAHLNSMQQLATTALEVFYQKVHAIAVEMGFVLKHAGHSVTIKERLDYSCAIFTACGELLTSAPHIPVHLGSMGECVRHLVAHVPPHELHDGDAWITNHPLQGGTHLPDITVITPVFIEQQLAFFVASRGHHGDVGGIAPASMPSRSKTLTEDGVVIPLRKIVTQHVFLEQEISALLQQPPYPVRNLTQNLHDLRAQLAANTRGRRGLEKLVVNASLPTVLLQAEELLSYTTAKVRAVLAKLPAQQAKVQMDKQRWLAVTFSKPAPQQFRLDFSGSCPADAGNFNTPPAVVKSACLYVLRCLLASDVPLNDGLGRELKLILPPDSIVNPPPEAAVVAGNVETSQALCDLLFEVFGFCAHAQGTMNNFSMGNASFQYYETIGGGSGASCTQPGRDATQVHMTNSSITDPEIIELLYPLLVRSNAVRRGSGGQGKFRGGDGIVRCVEFLQDMEVNLLSQRRETQPQGLQGGQAGMAGRNVLTRADGSSEALAGIATTRVQKGDRLVIATPGGGGYGGLVR